MKYTYPKEIYVRGDYEEGDAAGEDYREYDEGLTADKLLEDLEDGEVAIYKLVKVVNKKTEIKLEEK